MNDEILAEFIVEGYENLDRIDADLLALERGESSRELLASVFRSMHTIKGTCGFLGLTLLERVAHRGESLLSLMRDDKIAPSEEIFNVLLRTVDAIRSIMQELEATEEEGTESYESLVAVLEHIVEHGEPPAASRAPEAAANTPKVPAVPERPAVAPEAPSVAGLPETVKLSEQETPSPSSSSSEPAAPESPERPVLEVVNPATPSPGKTKPAAVPTKKSKVSASGGSSDGGSSPKSSLADSTIRVDVELLDRVMNLVGELVLARNRILQFAPQIADASFANASQRLNLLTTELQEGVMKTRMQPIGNVWSKFPRMVRDLSQSCGKRVELELDGTETELDRTIIEAIKDPLTHAVRNAVDHGVESPEIREANNKSPVGRLLLRAYHEGGQVNIEVSDDGAGLNAEKIKQRAIDRGLVNPDRVGSFSTKDIYNFIFHPGFSTAAAVTNVSGRGVGMDVVKTNIEKIGGSVDISSEVGVGTTLKVKIPLTLAIIPALTVTSKKERFAIPQVNLLELVRLESEQAAARIEHVFGSTMYRLRGNLLPLVFLDESLGLRAGELDSDEVLNIVVLQADDRHFGLVVDSIHDTEEIVVKPLGKELKGISAFAGATIMGDGQVALILDVLGLAERAQLVRAGANRSLVEGEHNHLRDGEERESLLVFETGDNARMAIQLSKVTRIEEIPSKKLEYAGDQLVVQYRGHILPLIDLREQAGYFDTEVRADGKDPCVSVIVYSHGGQTAVGFIVGKILDAVDEAIEVKRDNNKPGTLGSAVIQGKVTDLLDIEGVLRTSCVDLSRILEAA